MLRNFLLVIALSFAICASATAEGFHDVPIIEVEDFKVVGDSPEFLGEHCSDLIIERLVESQKFCVLGRERLSELLNEIAQQTGKDRMTIRNDARLNPDYIVQGTIELQKPKVSFIKVIIDFEIVDPKTHELIWGRRVWEESEVVPKKNVMIIHDTTYRTANKVVERLIADMDSDKIF